MTRAKKARLQARVPKQARGRRDQKSALNAVATSPTRAGAPEVTQAPFIETLAQQEAFLRQFAVIHNVTQAAQLSGIDRNRHYQWLADVGQFPDYAERFEGARRQALDHIRGAIMRRGVHGWDEPVYGNVVDQKTGKSKGTGVVGSVRKFSDRMAELAAKAHLPEFRDKLELTGPNNGPIQHAVALAILTPPERRARMKELAEVIEGSVVDGTTATVTPVVGETPAEAYARELAARVKGNGHSGNGQGGS